MKNCLILCSILLASTTFAQEEKSYIQPGLISTSLTLSPAKMLNRKDMNYYVSGYLEGRLDRHLSLRGEAHYMLGNANTKFLKNNARVLFGLEYGLPVRNADFHLGFMPGVSVLQSNFARNARWEVVPLISVSGGVKFYVWKFFNFFMHVNYIHTELNNLESISGKADELVFTGGLGYNIQLLKKYR